MAATTDIAELAAPSSGAAVIGDARSALPFCVVGIGASAGGLEAAKELLSALPADTGMAFMLVLHLPAHHESMLSEILARVSRLPVNEVRNGVEIARDHVYVLPAGSDLEIENGHLTLRDRAIDQSHYRPIDHYFHTLAACQGEKAIGVILSGTGSDGTLGIQEIKAAGGITFAQDNTAQQTSMPRSAIVTGAVDFILSPRDIAAELRRIGSHPLVAAEPLEEREPADLEPILEILRHTAGVDFAHYKRNTLYRRIARRVVLHKLEGIADYVRFLQSNPGESEALYQDILINVTSFFRNPEAFEALKSDVFPRLTHNRSRHDPVRIWTLGCSTGEEAYSLAMAFAEFTESTGHPLPLQIFATDLNGVSIDKARTGVYSRSAVQDVSSERLRRFFVEVDGNYRISKTIRDACVFARHNVLSDPPFSRVDLVSCRNMLIYLGAEIQQKVIPILHYALRPDGCLWLGTSETIGSYRELFDLQNTRYKIYIKKSVPGELPVNVMTHPANLVRVAGAEGLSERPGGAADSQKEIDRLLISRYAPPSVLIRGDLEILQYRGNTAPYLAPAPGKASLNLLKMLREDLVLGVRSALKRAKADEMPTRQEGLRLDVNGEERAVNVEVIPVKPPGVQRADVFMIVFDDVTESRAVTRKLKSDQAVKDTDASTQEIARLKQELTATREYLQSVIEQQEAANEELQSANEEVQSANEELQSINEELETSKEEIQSSNEELATVNDELQARNSELAQTNNDLINLLSSVQVAIVMLGPNMRIRRFTPMAEKLLNLIPTDIGRPVSDIKVNLDVPDLDAMLAEVIDTMAAREREVKDREGRWYLMRIRPYRTLENKIDGAVIVLIDVHTIKRNEELLRQQTELLNQAHEPIIMWEIDGAITYWNKAAEDTYGFTREQALGRKCHELLHTSPPFDSFSSELERERHWSGELIQMRRDGQKIIVDSRMVMVQEPKGNKLVVEASRPITVRKESDQILRRLADDLVSADRHKDEFLAMLAHELRNPLAPLRTAVSLLQAPEASERDKQRVLGIMDRQINNMTRLIDDLLDVSRITLSQIELRAERVDVVALVLRAVEQSESYFKPRDRSLQLILPTQPVYVAGDPVRLEQVIGNLLHNASKYTDKGGNVWLTVEQCPGAQNATAQREVVISVKDDGVGIEPDKLGHVFDLFMRATRSIDQKYGGLGVGLTLVRRLVEMHHGTVEARSEGPGKGSEFIIRLPALALAAETAAAATAQARPRDDTPRRVLVVDDSVDHAETLAIALRARRHEVQVADNGARALEIAAAFAPQIALIDIGMPEMDGYELARRLRHKMSGERVKLIALTGFGQESAKQRAREAGFDAYLVKPVEIERVVEALVS
jgi:two-component system CheB/CheR fusion protein